MINDYSKYDTQVQEWMEELESTLSAEVDDMPASYRMQLSLIADNLAIYLQAKDCLQKNGILIYDSRGGLVKNPAASIYNSSMAAVYKMLNSFALTRSAKAKLKGNLDESSENYEEDILG